MARTTIRTEDIADTEVTNAKVADDAIGVDELSASGTASASTFLRGDNAWAAAGGGKILQVTTNSYTTTATATDETVWSDSGITGSITPASTSNKVLIFAVIPCFTSALSETYSSRMMQLALCRGTGVGTVIHNCQFPMGRSLIANSTVQASSVAFVTLVYLDSPSTTSSQTYTIGYAPPASKIAAQTCQGDTAWVTCMEVEG